MPKSPTKTSAKSKKMKVVRRQVTRVNGLFVDGVSLDRATKRLGKKISIAQLKNSLTQKNNPPVVCRYYTILPFEDDSRQLAFLKAIAASGFDVVIKRLPPKTIDVQVSIAPEMSADIIAFAHGHSQFSGLSVLETGELQSSDKLVSIEAANEDQEESRPPAQKNLQRISTIVCPSKELSYALQFAREFKLKTISADFQQTAGRDVLKNADEWIDLSDTKDIWRE